MDETTADRIQAAVSAQAPRLLANTPIRVASVQGRPPARSEFVRACRNCGADFLALAVGKTGLRGLWSREGWWCSIECAPPELRAVAAQESATPLG